MEVGKSSELEGCFQPISCVRGKHISVAIEVTRGELHLECVWKYPRDWDICNKAISNVTIKQPTIWRWDKYHELNRVKTRFVIHTFNARRVHYKFDNVFNGSSARPENNQRCWVGSSCFLLIAPPASDCEPLRGRFTILGLIHIRFSIKSE